MKTVECINLSGHIVPIASELLVFRPAAYAILIHDDTLLLVKLKATGKYHLPGGGIELGERIEETLQREAYEETGLAIRVHQLVDFEELFFYYDPSGKAYHGLHFYYLCSPLSTDLANDDQIDDESAEIPRWVKIRDLKPEDFQHGGEKVLASVRARTKQK